MKNDSDKASVLNNLFASTFTRESLDYILFSCPSIPCMPMVIIIVPGVVKLLQSLNVNKANGPDGISTHFLQMCAEEFRC
jgi:hypothetical protein